MRFSIFPRFGALNSKPVFAAFTEGAKKLGYTVTEHDMSADVYVIWSVLWHGRMSANKEIWDQAKKLNKTIVVLEVGCLKRGTTWRMGRGHVNNDGYFGLPYDLIPNRSEKLGLKLSSWTMNGRNILICGQHTKSEQWSMMPHPIAWLKNTIDNIKIHSERPIIFRPHPRDWHWAANFSYKNVTVRIPKQIQGTYDDFDFNDDLKNAWAVVNPSSNTGILSVISGVPAFVTSSSLAKDVANLDFSFTDNPERPRREEWFERLCHTEWTIDEIAQGTPLTRIFSPNS
jgi:hypothetical protein